MQKRFLMVLMAALPLALFAGRAMADVSVIQLNVQAGRFNPTTVTAPAGIKFKLHVNNAGPGAEEFESSDLNREIVVAPGHSIDVFLGPLQPGSYRFFGDFHPDTAQGRLVIR